MHTTTTPPPSPSPPSPSLPSPSSPPPPLGGLRIDLGGGASLPDRPDSGIEPLPPLAALFLIYFDIKAGYTIRWKRIVPGVDLDGVEFKSLPSGLHNLKEDLVYFVHEKCAGVSAFVNAPAEESQRGALMVSVGILVPLSYGRLGRSWRHAEGLKTLARQYSSDRTAYAPFEEYFERHKALDEDLIGTISSPISLSRRKSTARCHFRTNSVSEATALITPGQTLSQHHPALSLSDFVDTFGPLIFPLYRAALARKRILIITNAPVERTCNFVYDISILSNIPLSVSDLLPCEPSRLKPLFSVGVHDIPTLEFEAKGDRSGFVACTTDDILAMKTNLYDILVRMPPNYAVNASQKAWPTLATSDGTPLLATQRDLRRYRALRHSLLRRYSPACAPTPTPSTGTSEPSSDGDDEPNNIEDVCEKLSWREIAYSGFIWWASAGEKRNEDEADDGRLLLDTHFAYTPTMTSGPMFGGCVLNDADVTTDVDVQQQQPIASTSAMQPTEPVRNRRRTASFKRRPTSVMMGNAEMDLIAYFHRSTQRIITGLSDSERKDANWSSIRSDEDDEESRQWEGADDEETLIRGEEEEREETGWISLDEVSQMGLDRYSERDAGALKDIAERWLGREVEVERWRCRVCGVECG